MKCSLCVSYFLEEISGGGLVAKSCLTLVTPWTVVCQAPLSIEFPRQEYWSGLPFPSAGDLPFPGIELRSPALQADSLLPELKGKPSQSIYSPLFLCIVHLRRLSYVSLLFNFLIYCTVNYITLLYNRYQ